MRGDGVCNRKIGIARLTPGDTFIPTRSLSLPSRPYGKRSSSRSFRRAAACFADACVTPPITPAWLQSPEHLHRPGDFRSYCHAPARLWPPKPSTDSLDLTRNRPTRGARLFQTGALLTHFKGEAVTANCLLHSARSAFRSLAVPPFLACSSQPSVRRAGFIPPSLPREVQ